MNDEPFQGTERELADLRLARVLLEKVVANHEDDAAIGFRLGDACVQIDRALTLLGEGSPSYGYRCSLCDEVIVVPGLVEHMEMHRRQPDWPGHMTWTRVEAE